MRIPDGSTLRTVLADRLDCVSYLWFLLVGYISTPRLNAVSLFYLSLFYTCNAQSQMRVTKKMSRPG
jgi:hypothetical protein